MITLLTGIVLGILCTVVFAITVMVLIALEARR